MTDTTTYTVKLEGKYTWNLLLDLDNTHGGEYKRTERLEVRTKLSRAQSVKKIIKHESTVDASFKNKVEAGAKVKLVSLSASSEGSLSHHTSLLSEIETSTSDSFERETKEVFEEVITVGPGEMFRLYQLQFDGPGVSASLRVKATEPRQEAPVSIICVVEVIEQPLTGGVLHEGLYTIKSTHGTYLRGCPRGAKVDLQTQVGLWEKWYLVKTPDGRFGIRSWHGTYIRAAPGGVGAKLDLQVDKQDWSKMPWEQFTFTRV